MFLDFFLKFTVSKLDDVIWFSGSGKYCLMNQNKILMLFFEIWLFFNNIGAFKS